MKSCALAGALLAFSVSCVTGSARAGGVAAYQAPPPLSGAAVPGNFYAGLSFGARWSDTDWTTSALGSPSPPQVPANSTRLDSGTVRVAGYTGYMWRVTPSWALGIEGDLGWGDSSRGVAGIPGPCCGGFARVQEGWDGSLRGRLGYLLTPAWLLYATGGIAWQGLDIEAACSGGKSSFCTSAHDESFSTTRAGWTLGVGIEVMMRQNCLVRVEYRFADYGRVDHTFFAAPAADRVAMSEALTTQTLMVGLAWKLGPGSAIIARH